MEIVYADRLFGLNLIIDYFLLLCSARVCGVTFRRVRYALAAALGAAWAVGCVLPGLVFLSAAPMKLALGGAMALIAFGGETHLLRCFAVFLCVSAAFGGAVWGASMLAGGPLLSGGAYLPGSGRVLALSFAACYAAVSLVFRRAAKRAERQVQTLTLRFQGRETSLRALRDTGNGLCDPVSGAPVLVAEARELLPLLPAGAGEALSAGDCAAALTRLAALPGCAGRFRLIPYSAVGVSGGLLIAFRPDSAALDGRPLPDVLAALSPTSLSETGEYSAVV